MYVYFRICRRNVLYFAYFYFSLVIGFQNWVNKRLRILSERNFRDDKRFVIEFLDFRTHLYVSATHSVVVARDIHVAACGEIGI